MNQKIRSHKMFVVAALAVVSLMSGVFAADSVQALSATAPDPSTGGGYDNSNSRFVLERTAQNTVTSISVPVYLPNRPTGAVSMSVVDFKYPWAGNQPRVSFQGGAYQGGNRTFTIPASAFALDASTSYYKASATARLDPSVAQDTYAIAEFRLRVNVSGGLIGIGGGQRYSTIPDNYYSTNVNDTYDYSIPFATPCTISTDTNGIIRLDDLDSGTVDNLYNTITVRVRDETAGTTFSLTQVSGSSMTDDFRGQMTFQPGHKYRLLVNNVHANNSLMYTFPYDNIAYKVGCAWSLLGINSQNRVQVGGAGNFSSYGDYHQGSPRTVRPGDIVQFQHEVRNSGNMRTSTFSRWRERNGWQGMAGWPQQGGTFQSTLNAGQSARWPASPTSYRVQVSDVGRTLCERYGVQGQSSTNSSAYRSTASCVYVERVFTLTPVLTGASGNGSPGSTIADIAPEVRNQAGAQTSPTPDTVRWQIGRIDVAPGGSIHTGMIQNGNAPSAQYGGSWQTKASWTGTRSFGIGTTMLSDIVGEEIRTDTPIGTRVCFTLSVQPYSNTSNQWRHAAPLCIGVNKRPTVQIWGGDLRVGGNIDTGTSRGKRSSGSDATFGSWVEYGAFSRGANEGLASDSGMAEGTTEANRSAWSKLTFANTPNYGNFNFTTPYDLASQFAPTGGTTSVASGTFSLNGRAAGTYVPTGDITVSGTVSSGRVIIIYAPSRSITINNDIIYGGEPYTSRSQVPQLIIVANNIYINDNVEKVNAWLLASNVIDTCANRATRGSMAGSLSSSLCDRQLRVNGPVTTSRLVLKRTAGAEAGSFEDPAEIFNLRADAYLWRYNAASAEGRVRVISSRELPPRF